MNKVEKLLGVGTTKGSDMCDNIMNRTADHDVDFWEGYGDIAEGVRGGGLDSFEIRMKDVDGESLEAKLERLEEWIDRWGAGRGIKFDRAEILTYDDFWGDLYNVYFTPGFDSDEDLFKALGDEDGII